MKNRSLKIKKFPPVEVLIQVLDEDMQSTPPLLGKLHLPLKFYDRLLTAVSS